MKTLLFIGFAVFAVGFCFLFDNSTVQAESNAPKCAIQKFDDEYKNSKAVFVGKVVKEKKDGNKKIFEFEVSKYWKGIESKMVKVVVTENMRFQAQFKLDGNYLVFAKDNEEGGLWDGRCSRSRDLEGFGGEVEEDLTKLGDAKTCIDLDG